MLAAVATLVVAFGYARGGAAAASQRQWCEARSSRAWHRVLTHHVVSLSRTTSLDPWTLAHDGRSFFATVYSTSFSGVARIDAMTDSMTKIKAFSDPANEQADGAFDGRWLVWNEYRGFTSFDDFTTWAWDARAGTLRQIGAATRGPNGRFWGSPWRGPDVRASVATWVQGSGPDGLTDVHVYNLRSRRDTIVPQRHAQGSFLLRGHLVAWPESPSPGSQTRMYVASSIDGKPVHVPRVLRNLRGVSGLATDGRRIAYPNAQYKALWWSRSLKRDPQRILVTRGVDHIDNSVQIGSGWIGFGIQPRVFVGDTKAHRYVEVTAHGGWTRVDARTLLVVYATGSKALAAHAPIAFMPLRDLPPVPACA